MTTTLPLFFLAIFVSATAYSQNEPGESFKLNSAVLNETRKIQVYVPAPVYSIAQTYPVLYVVDGESLYWPVISAARFMNSGSSLPQVPEAIIVSIINTNRNRDMPIPQEIETSNVAANFFQFFTEELIPYINKHYPVNGLNVLIGHSQGGLFVTYAGLQKPKLFPFILALDAPMTVNPSLLNKYQQKMATACMLNYFSAETKFGWGKDLLSPAGCNSYFQKRIEEETHETMPYKGIYEGLKFLFREHIPPDKNISLATMQAYYNNLSKKYNCTYKIPAALLLAIANEKVNVSKKEEAIGLIAYYENNYGESQRTINLMAKAKAITAKPDNRIDFYLNHPGPSTDELKSYMGKWKGTVFVPGGSNTDITWEIKKVNDKYVMDARVMNEFNSLSDFLLVTDQHELAWGRKHDGGGIYLSIGKLSDDGETITGTEDLIGFRMPDGWPAFKQNTFEFKKVKE